MYVNSPQSLKFVEKGEKVWKAKYPILHHPMTGIPMSKRMIGNEWENGIRKNLWSQYYKINFVLRMTKFV